MDAFVDMILSNPAYLLGISILVLCISIALIIKRLISFVITCILITAAGLSCYTLLHHDEVRDILRDFYEEKTGNHLSDVPDDQKNKNLFEYLKDGWQSTKELLSPGETDTSE